ncbi:MAG: C40 family peptidase [Acidobacteria bacterium]|nr:C40 family peptidase [Acidobacteriota bacterium]
MLQAYRLEVCLLVFALLLATNLRSVEARQDPQLLTLASDHSFDFNYPDLSYGLSFRSKPTRFSPSALVLYSPIYSDETESLLYEAVRSRIGLPYRSKGTDDRGYDCSGFVWRVFRDAGIDFDRSPARKLWQTLPKATEKETRQFGTLVFFRGLNHVGIVRDAHSFYHASSSKGVVRSYFDEYWGGRVTGYRRVFAPVKKQALVRRR